jgi:hypothetical protein
MKVLFNEISARTETKDADLASFQSTVLELIDDLRFLQLVNPSSRPIFYAGNVTGILPSLETGCNSLRNIALRTADSEIRLLILQFVGSLNYLTHEDKTTHKEGSTGEDVAYIDSFGNVEKSTMASISLKGGTAWHDWELTFLPLQKGKMPFVVPHLGRNVGVLLKYIDALFGIIYPLASAATRALDAKSADLPQKTFSNALIRRIQPLIDASKTPNEKSANALLLGNAVAKLNAYERAPEVEAKNASDRKLRKIFFSPDTKRYLSIDVMHGTFEVCDVKGQHLREINFKGERLEGAKANHSIVV